MKISAVLLLSLTLAASCTKEVKKVQNQAMEEKINQVQEIAAATYHKENSEDASAYNHFTVVMDERQALGMKLIEASKYFRSMEFQRFSKPNTPKGFKTREQMYDEAAFDFTNRLASFKNKKMDADDMNPYDEGKKHNEETAFYALAATMDDKIGTVSFYELMKAALIKDSIGGNMDPHESKIVQGDNKKRMINLIKARVDILAAFALNDLADDTELSVSQKFKQGIFKATGGRLGNIDLPETYDKVNGSTKNQILRHLELAVDAKHFLRELGIDKDLQKKMKKAYSNIDFNETPASQQTAERDEKKEAIRTAITNLLE